jgi:hypothetical protein
VRLSSNNTDMPLYVGISIAFSEGLKK